MREKDLERRMVRAVKNMGGLVPKVMYTNPRISLFHSYWYCQ